MYAQIIMFSIDPRIKEHKYNNKVFNFTLHTLFSVTFLDHRTRCRCRFTTHRIQGHVFQLLSLSSLSVVSVLPPPSSLSAFLALVTLAVSVLLLALVRIAILFGVLGVLLGLDLSFFGAVRFKDG